VVSGLQYCYFAKKFISSIFCGTVMCMGGWGAAQIFQTSGSHIKILGARRVTRIKFRAEVPQILGATVRHLIPTATCGPGFLHLCPVRCETGSCVCAFVPAVCYAEELDCSCGKHGRCTILKCTTARSENFL
jgi:hypothetical protein